MSQSGDELYDVIAAIYSRQKDYREISPISLAAEAMKAIDFPMQLHPLGHIGCEMHCRQIARSFCRKKFDPVDPAQGEMFSCLQERYPTRPRTGEEPCYVLRRHLSTEDRDYNVARMRRVSSALQKHADALEADGITPRPALATKEMASVS